MLQPPFQKRIYGDKGHNDPQIQRPKKYKNKSNLAKGLKIGAVLILTCVSSGVGLRFYATKKNSDYLADNQIFETSKINRNIDFYGGDERYVLQTLNALSFQKSPTYSHFNTKDNLHIKVGVSNQFSKEEKEQIQIYYDYLNDLFKTINPLYHFEVCDYSDKCSISILKESLPSNIGGQCRCKTDSVVTSRVKKVTISLNKNLKPTNQALKIYLAHEMMHTLLGSPDVDYTQSNTFSVYNYDDCAFMINQLENAVTKEPTSGWHVRYPVMTEQQKNTFISYTPVDVATLIAVYGKGGGTENQKKYVELLMQTLETCGKVYGDNQPFFEDSFDFGSLADKYLESDDFSK